MSAEHKDARLAALRILEKLRARGHTALLAGGCVRDMLLSISPKDYDVATDATPKRVVRIFPRSRTVGAKFGVVLVRQYGHDIEVATFRSDGTYSDGRHPDTVVFGTDVEDARRRDFTINGLFFDPIEERVIDHVDGRRDIEAGVIRTIGEPEARFAEDHLRMLRAIRFAARLGFLIEPRTMAAIKCLAQRLGDISTERVWLELEAILTAPTRAIGWSLLVETGLREHLVAGWHGSKDEDEMVRRRLEALPPHPVDPPPALAAVFLSHRRAQVDKLCGNLRLSNRQTVAVGWLIEALPAARHERTLELADLKLMMADDNWCSLLDLLRADLMACGSSLEPVENLQTRAGGISADAVAPPPLLGGNDLSAMGLTPGPKFGTILKSVYRAQLNEQINSPEDARRLARRLMDESTAKPNDEAADKLRDGPGNPE